jgi:NADH-quinone oxidoreductase subunit N
MALNAAIGAWYYLRIVAVMFLRPAPRPTPTVPELPGFAGVCVCATLTLALFLAPGILWHALRLVGS